MTEEERLRHLNEAWAKELAVACNLLAQWGRNAPRTPFSGIATPDFSPQHPPTLRHNIDRVSTNASDLILEGWAFDPARGNPPAGSHAIFVRVKSGGWLAFATTSLLRPDVARHYTPHLGPLPHLEESGFYAVLPADVVAEAEGEIMIVQQQRSGFWGRTPPFLQRFGVFDNLM